jgi:perosamine synthetase
MSVPPEVRDRDPLAREQYVEPAYNCRMTDLEAAIGRPQLAKLDAFMAERRRLAAGYAAALVNHPVLAAPLERPDSRANWQSYPAQLRPESQLDQDQVLRFFFERGIACRRGVSNAHEEPAYAGRDNWRAAGPLPVSESLRRSTVMLPLFHGMTREEERIVKGALGELARQAAPSHK